MKKLITTLLTTCLLAALVLPASVSAAITLPNDAAVYLDDDSSLSGSAVINGDLVITDGDLKLAGSSNISGTVYLTDSAKLKGKNTTTAKFEGKVPKYEPYEIKKLPDNDAFSKNQFSNGTKDLTISWNGPYINNYLLQENAYINKLTVPAGCTLKIEAPEDTVRVIRVCTLSVAGSIEIQGTGTVILYVDKSFKLQNANLNTNTMDPNRLTLVFADDEEMSITNAKIAANIVSSLEELQLNAVEITGNLYVKDDIRFTNSGEINGLVYAPNSEVKLTGSAKINGQLIAESLEMSGNCAINFKEVSPLPDQVEDVINSGNIPEDPPDAPIIDNPEENEPSKDTIRVVEYDVASNTYRSGTMKTKLHTPIGVDVTYTVLDEESFVADQRTVSQRDKDWAKTICDVTNSVFDFRRADISLNPFGRVDFAAYQYSLTISPYVVPILEQEEIDVQPDSWLVWGDQNGHVIKVWMTVSGE